MKAFWQRRPWREPDGGNLHARFDEAEGSGGHWFQYLSSRALLSTLPNNFHNLGGGYVVIGVAEQKGHPVLPPAWLNAGEMDAIQKEVLNLGHRAMQPFCHPIMVAEVVAEKHALVLWAPGGQTRPYKAKVSLGKDAKEWGCFATRLPLQAQTRDATDGPNRVSTTGPFAPEAAGEGARSESGSGSRSEWRSEWGPRSVNDRITAAISATPLARSETAGAIGHKSIAGAMRRALADLVAAGWVELTVPAKPNSRLQKYRATGRGRS